MAARAPIEISELMALRASCEQAFLIDDEQIREMRLIRNMEGPIAIDQDLLVAPGVMVHDPTVHDEINRVVATMAKHDPDLHIIPGRPSDTGWERATRLEHWTWETIKVAATRIQGRNALYGAWDAILADGAAWCKLVYVRDTWEERFGISLKKYRSDAADKAKASGGDVETALSAAESMWDEDTETAKKRAGPPFTMECCDVASVYPIFDGGKLAEMIEVTYRPRISTLKQYAPELIRGHLGQGLSKDEANNQSASTVEVIEHWDDTTATYLLMEGGNSGRIIRQFKHGYGRVPYFVAMGRSNNEWRGRKVGHGVAHNKRWLSELRSLLLTLMVQDSIRYASPPVGWEHADTAQPLVGKDGVPVEMKERKISLNRILEMQPGDRLAVFPTQSISPSVMGGLNYISHLEEGLDTPHSSQEVGGAMAGAGFAISQVMAAAKTKQDPFIQSMQQMLTEIIQFMWHLTRTKVKEKVWVSSTEGTGAMMRTQWLGVGEDDLKSIVGLKVVFDPEDESTKLVKIRALVEMMKAGLMGRDQAMESLGMNPDEVRLSITLDAMREEEWYKALRSQQVLQTLGRGDLLKNSANAVVKTGQLPGMPPQIAAQMDAMAKMRTQQQAMNPAQPPQMTTGPGRETPDFGALMTSPGGAGSAPMTPGGVPGGPQTPQLAGAAGIQQIAP